MPRNVDRSIRFPVKRQAQQYEDGVLTGNISDSKQVVFVRTRNGANCPDWKGKIARGENATTAMTAVYDDGWSKPSKGQFIADYKNGPPPHHYERIIPRFDATFYSAQSTGRGPRGATMDVTPTVNAAAASFYKKLRAQQVVMSGPTFLGEAREALHMLRRPGEAFYKDSKGLLDAYRNLKREDPKGWMKRASGLWLEKTFGWQPLINDAKDAAKALRSLGKDRNARVSAGAQRSADMTSTLPTGDNKSNFIDIVSTYWSSTCRLTEKTTVRFRSGIRAQAELPQWTNWDAFGFTPSEFLPTAWELLPWSFLADYFTNIGDMIAANATCTANVAFVNRDIIQETFYKGSIECNVALSGQTPYAAWNNIGYMSPSSFYFHRKQVTRSAGLPLPIVTFTLDTGLSDGQLYNVLALLGQANELHHQDYRWRRG